MIELKKKGFVFFVLRKTFHFRFLSKMVKKVVSENYSSPRIFIMYFEIKSLTLYFTKRKKIVK